MSHPHSLPGDDSLPDAFTSWRRWDWSTVKPAEWNSVENAGHLVEIDTSADSDDG
ncbi:uncharacterized protein LAESUDRAFT_724130 [Laetiporus sulphureus 93-53]|uniref:Uncharacterized protein n=1 Tax=Laetiporus sulphureus 93-53 TaxID=1314785 RepID=A0A165F0T6_9APHY|nr:uncharacterized protein LAESUDRAFT_724130 [Laetiporus sulphureus 93-53]KZT08128.1 hypothetical protein LAESUDRAFT_724130 [Laetiporus sulphureus 93-53]